MNPARLITRFKETLRVEAQQAVTTLISEQNELCVELHVIIARAHTILAAMLCSEPAINGAPASKLKLQVNLHHMKFKMPFLLQHVDNSEH